MTKLIGIATNHCFDVVEGVEYDGTEIYWANGEHHWTVIEPETGMEIDIPEAFLAETTTQTN